MAMQARPNAYNRKETYSYSSANPGTDAQPLPLAQSIHEAVCNISTSETIGRKANVGRGGLHYNIQAPDEEIGSIGSHTMVFTKKGSAEFNKVFSALNQVTVGDVAHRRFGLMTAIIDTNDVGRLVYVQGGGAGLLQEALDAWLAGNGNPAVNPPAAPVAVGAANHAEYVAGMAALVAWAKEERHEAMRDVFRFVGILQTEIMHHTVSYRSQIPRREDGSAVFGGLYPVYNPYKLQIGKFETVVWDIPEEDDPFTEIAKNKRFGFYLIRPFLRKYDPTKKYDSKYIVGKTLNSFDPNTGAMLHVQLRHG